MATIAPFRAVRPRPELASQVAAPPYDVVSLEEARKLAEGNPYSFLRIGRAELELGDGIDPYSDRGLSTRSRQSTEAHSRWCLDSGIAAPFWSVPTKVGSS